MGHLVDIDLLDRADPQLLWMFTDAEWNTQKREWTFEVSTTYPYEIMIPYCLVDGTLRVRIHRWIDENIKSDVIVERLLIPYTVEEKGKWKSIEDHGYYIFSFRSLAEKMRFKAAFPLAVTDQMLTVKTEHSDMKTHRISVI